MKHIFSLDIPNFGKIQSPVLYLIIILITGCMSNSPSRIADKFLIAVIESEYKEARKYSTSETCKLIDLLESLNSISSTSEFQELGDNGVKIQSESINGDTAWVEFTYSGIDEVEKLELRKIDGKWLAHVT